MRIFLFGREDERGWRASWAISLLGSKMEDPASSHAVNRGGRFPDRFLTIDRTEDSQVERRDLSDTGVAIRLSGRLRRSATGRYQGAR